MFWVLGVFVLLLAAVADVGSTAVGLMGGGTSLGITGIYITQYGLLGFTVLAIAVGWILLQIDKRLDRGW